MKISEVIEQLKKIQEEHGDLPLYRWKFDHYGEVNNGGAQIAHTKKLAGRERNTQRWSDYMGDKLKDKKVVEIL